MAVARVRRNARTSYIPAFVVASGRRVSLRIVPGEDGWLVVTSPTLRGLVTQGKTLDEAIRNGLEAAELLLEPVGHRHG